MKPYWLTALNGGVNIFKLMAGATGTASARTEVLQRATSPGTERGSDEGSGEHEGQWQTDRREEASNGKALSDLPALKPYWGKPAVRNFREGNGNVGIIRSPLRAFALPDQSSGSMAIQVVP